MKTLAEVVEFLKNKITEIEAELSEHNKQCMCGNCILYEGVSIGLTATLEFIHKKA